jgi:hypothetical protein
VAGVTPAVAAIAVRRRIASVAAFNDAATISWVKARGEGRPGRDSR